MFGKFCCDKLAPLITLKHSPMNKARAKAVLLGFVARKFERVLGMRNLTVYLAKVRPI